VSIIQEALRRREAEAGNEHVRLSVPPSGAGPQPEKKEKQVSTPLLVALAAALVVGGVFWYPRLRRPARPVPAVRLGEPAPSPAERRPVSSTSVEPTGGIAERALAAAGITPPTATTARVQQAEGADQAGTGDLARATEPRVQEPRASTTSPAPSSPDAMGPTNAVAGTESAGPPSTAAPAVPVAWPSFQVKGVVLGRAGSGSVILDRGIVEVGQTTLEGVRVVRIEGEVAVMEFRGEERRFRVGSSSP